MKILSISSLNFSKTSFKNQTPPIIEAQNNDELSLCTIPVEKAIFSDIESSIYDVIEKYCKNALPFNFATLNRIFKKETKTTPIEGMYNIINSSIEKFEKQNGALDRKYLKENMLVCAKNKCYESKKEEKLSKKPNMKTEIYEAFMFAILKSLVDEDDSFENKLNLFKRELLDYGNNNDVLSLAYLKKLIQVFAPDVEVKKQNIFKRSFKNVSGTANVLCFYEIKDGKVQFKPLKKSFEFQPDLEKEPMLRSIAHEMTHILQYTTLDKSYFGIIEKLANENLDYLDSLMAGENVFYEIEDVLFSLQISDYRDKIIDLAKQDGDEVCIDETFKKQVSNALTVILDNYTEEMPNFNRKAALTIARAKTLDEIEAYKNEFSFGLSTLSKEEYLELKTIIKTFEILLEIINSKLA